MFKSLITFKPSFPLRIIVGLLSFTILLGVCFVTYVTDVTANLSARDIEFRGRLIEQGARYYKEQCSRCHGADGRGIEGLGPGISNANFLGKLEFRTIDGQRVVEQVSKSPRLEALGYRGSLRDYIRSVTASGIAIKSSPDWAEPHPPFDEKYGGPLRNDQIENITMFVMNWGFEPYADEGSIMPIVAGAAPRPTAVPLTAEQEAGKAVYLKAGCTACHAVKGVGSQGGIGPNLSKLGATAAERIASEHYKTTLKDQPAATAPEAYIRQSILYPQSYITEKCPQGACIAGVMPQNYSQQISEGDLTNLVAYLSSLK
jgi:mono/diheme cytochrome c family protein